MKKKNFKVLQNTMYYFAVIIMFIILLIMILSVLYGVLQFIGRTQNKQPTNIHNSLASICESRYYHESENFSENTGLCIGYDSVKYAIKIRQGWYFYD